MWGITWNTVLVARFGPREELPREELIHRVWGYFDAKAVGELLDELEGEFLVPAGILRPDDPILWLLEPEPAGNWFMQLLNNGDAGSAEISLMEALEERLSSEQRRRLLDTPQPLLTLGELAWVWCNGRVPPWLETEEPGDHAT